MCNKKKSGNAGNGQRIAAEENSTTPPPADRMAASYGRTAEENNEVLNRQFCNNREQAISDGFIIPNNSVFRFEDDNTTGLNERRTGFNRLLHIVQSGEAPFERVYMTDPTRLGRWPDPRFISLKATFEKHGVRLVYAQSESHLDSPGPNEL